MRREDGKGRSAAIEILLNTPTIAEKIFKGEFHEIKDIMAQLARARHVHLRLRRCSSSTTQALIGFDEAIRNADSANELRLNIKLQEQARRARGLATSAASRSTR